MVGISSRREHHHIALNAEVHGSAHSTFAGTGIAAICFHWVIA